MNAIISNGNYTASVQLPVDRRQLAGALSYLGKNHASAYDIQYNEESDKGLSFTLDCRGVVENAIAKAIPTGFRFHTFNDTIALMHNLPYQSRREFENTVKVEGLASYEQLDRMLSEAYPQSVTTKYYGFEEPTYSGDTGTMTFLTANGSPFRVLFKLSEKYPDVEFELCYADEDLGYNVGEISFIAGELIDDNSPQEGTAVAQELAADIIGIELSFDINSASGYVLSLLGNYYEYCEGVHVSPSFQCDASLGHLVVLCYDEDNGKVWLELDRLHGEDTSSLEEAEANIRAWGVHRCNSWDDYNGYVYSLGDDAMESAYHNEEGMTLC